MIEDVDNIQDLLAGGQAEWIAFATSLLEEAAGASSELAQGALRVLRGQALVRHGYLLPIIDGKTSTKGFVEYNNQKYRDVLADPGQASGEIAGALFVNGSENYYHFFVNHFSALLFLNSVRGERVPLVTVHGFPTPAESLLVRVMPIMAGGRGVDVTRVVDDTYDVEDVIFPLAPQIFLPALVSRRILLPFVLGEAGIGNALRELGGIKLFVRREGGSDRRNLVNQAEVEAWFVARGYVSVNPGSLSVEEQIILFSRATHIAGVEGAALTNILFAVNATQILMIASPITRGEDFLRVLVERTETQFHTVYGELCDPKPHFRHSNYTLAIDHLDALDRTVTS